MDLDYSSKSTLNLGNPAAEHELTVVVNLGCPFCRKWYVNNREALLKNIEHDSLNVHIKFWNKDKASLQNGNTANDYVDYQNQQAALEYIDQAFAAQKVIDNLPHDEVAHFLESEFNVERHVSDEVAQANNQSLLANGLASVPTIILDGAVVGDSNYQLRTDL